MLTEAQKRAQKKYYDEKRSKTHKTISITMTVEQAVADKQIIAKFDTTPSAVWRRAIDQLKNQPTKND